MITRDTLRRGGLMLGLAIFITFMNSGASGVSAQQRPTQSPAQGSPDGLWNPIEERNLAAPAGERLILPQRYLILRLNQNGLSDLFRRAPREFSPEAQEGRVTMTLPMPDGSYGRFRIMESPIMAPELAAQFPELKTYVGQGMDDPTAVARMDLTPAGFHASILSAGDTVYIDPYQKGDTTTYITYNGNDYQKARDGWQCFYQPPQALPKQARQPGRVAASVGTELRTFRFAVATTGEYTIFHGGTVAKALAAITTTLNRVNGIYERDYSIRFILIADEAKIIYTDPGTAPYTNLDTSKLIDENQKNLDAVIGDANYDLGHVFCTASGGVGAAGLCETGAKARGVTGLAQPIGDKFDVEYVAHETIHQLAGNHVFNSTQDGCGESNRNQATAVEPGSGSTTASYASLCGPADLQDTSDDYFNGATIEEVLAYVAGAGKCAKSVATNNRPPTVSAGPSFTIPKLTPFTLTATGSDPDGDTIVYTWEEQDAGNASPPEEDDGTRAIFRSFRGTTSPSRTFPRLVHILNNANVPPQTYLIGDKAYLTGEQLPKTSRTMKFKVTARDNKAGGGGVNTADTQVTIAAGAGPFVVLTPNTAVTLAAGTTLTVTWGVANTNAAPVSAANVKISLSSDGGETFPVILAESVPNQGSAIVQVPNIATAKARIKVEAVGNVFFDISDTNFTITASSAPAATTSFAHFANGNQWVSSFVLTNPSANVPAAGSISFFSDPGQSVKLSVNGALAESTVQFSIAPFGSAVFTTDGAGALVSGSAQVSSDNPVSGVTRFSHPTLGIAGVGDSASLSSLMTPIVRNSASGLSTGIAICNTGSAAVTATLSLRGLNGQEVTGGSATQTLAGNGHIAMFVEQLFPAADTANFQGTLVVTVTTAGGKVSATAIQLGSGLGQFTTLPVVPINPAPTSKELYFAQYANGSSWTSSIFLNNPSGTASAGEITVYDDSGNKIAFAVNGQPAATSAPFSVNPGGGAVFTTDGQGALVAGSARAIGSSAIGGVLRFAAPSLGLAGVGASSPVAGFITPIRRSAAANLSTGVAVASVGSPVTLTFVLRGKNGQAVAGGQVTRSLNANGHLASFIEQIFPDANTSDLEGTLTVTAAGGSVVGTAIQLGAKAGEITTLPVTPIRP